MSRTARGGADIVKVLGGSPAQAAHLVAGQVIIGFAGHEIASSKQLGQVEKHLRPGELVDLSYKPLFSFATVRRIFLHLGQWDHQTCVPITG